MLRPARLSHRFALPPHLVVMGLVFVAACVVGFLLLPDDNERIAMLERDGQDQQALEILQHRFESGDRDHRTLFQLQSLYEQSGNLEGARSMLELLASLRPRDANVQRHLAEFYRATQDEAGYIRVQEARLQARFSQPVCRELIGLYRRAGNYDAEQRTLSYCHDKGYRRTDDIIRLAKIKSVDGKLGEAASLLRAIDDRRQLRSEGDRVLLFSALIAEDGADEARKRAARWYKGNKEDDLVLQLIDMLAGAGKHDLAVALASEVGKPGDAISLAVAELMLDREQVVAARSYLRGWLQSAHLESLDIAERMIRAALDAEDPLLAYQAGEIFGLKKLSQDDLVALAEALSAVEQPDAFHAVQQYLAPGAMKDNPLLAAAVEFEQGQAEPARQLLSRIQAKALEDWRLALWARLMAQTGRRATAEQTLRDIAAEVRGTGGPPVNITIPEVAAGTPAPVAVEAPVPVERPHVGGGARRASGSNIGSTRLIRRNTYAEKRAPRRSRLRRPPAQSVKAPSFPGPASFGLPPG